MTTFLTGKLVQICTFDESHVEPLTEWINTQDISQYINAFRPMMLEEEKKWRESLVESKTDFVFALISNDADRKFFGIMGVHRVDHRNQTASTGAIIGVPAYQGKGYGTDAKMHILHWAFNELNLRKINSSVLATNPRSQAYLEKTGYQKVGKGTPRSRKLNTRRKRRVFF